MLRCGLAGGRGLIQVNSSARLYLVGRWTLDESGFSGSYPDKVLVLGIYDRISK